MIPEVKAVLLSHIIEKLEAVTRLVDQLKQDLSKRNLSADSKP